MDKQTIGVIGGFGGYATADFYERLLEAFRSDNERNYPHMIFDNNFSMPSRTKALLSGRNSSEYWEIVYAVLESIKLLIEGGATYIILPCGTAHAYLDDIYNIFPEAKSYILDIIECLGKRIKDKLKGELLIIAAEGALKEELYPKRLSKYLIECKNLTSEYYDDIRYFIECTKQKTTMEKDGIKFKEFLDQFKVADILLGCTEFPPFINQFKYTSLFYDYVFYDPLEAVIEELKIRIRK